MSSSAPVHARPKGLHSPRVIGQEAAKVPKTRRGVDTKDAIVVASFLALAIACFWPTWSGGIGHLEPGSSDEVQMIWYLNWVPYAIGHGLNPLHSSLVNVPYGMNMLNQTSAMFVGLLLSPITVIFGPTATLNVGLTLAMAGSAASMYFVTRRFVNWRPAAFAAGLLYGFGPYEIGQGPSHLQLSFCVFPPIILLLVSEIAVRTDGRNRLRGIVLGLLVVAQFFVSSEVLAMTAVVGAMLLVVIAVRGRRVVLAHLTSALRGFVWAGGVAGVLLAYPVWYALAGPDHVTGFFSIPAYYRADLLGAIVPDSHMQLAPSSLAAVADQFGGNTGENGSYLGIPLLVILAFGVTWLHRRAEVQVAVIVGFGAYLCSLGSRLAVQSAPGAGPNGVATGRVPLPWAIATHLPLLRDVLTVRFSQFVAMAAAFLLAITADALFVRAGSRRGAAVGAIASIGLLTAALIPLVPADVPFGSSAIPSAPYFASSAAQQLPAAKVALIYPYPSGNATSGQAWQIQSDMRFATPGGYFFVPQPPPGWRAGSALTPYAVATTTGAALAELYLGHPPAQTASLRAAIRNELGLWNTQSVVAIPPAGTAPTVVEFLSWVLGVPPVHQAGAFAWYRVQVALHMR